MYRKEENKTEDNGQSFKEMKLNVSKDKSHAISNSGKDQINKSAFEMNRPATSQSGANIDPKTFNNTTDGRDNQNHLVPVVKQPANGGPPSTAIDNAEEQSQSEPDIGDSQGNDLNKSGKLKPFEEDVTNKIQFEKQLAKFAENVVDLTPYTIYGLSVKSEFSIAV